MKYLKLFALGFLPLAFTACSDDEEVFNSSEATVEFETASISVKENTSMLNIPILVKGEHNGKIVVNATMTDKTDGIEIDKNVIITTETLNIGKETKSVNLEVVFSGISNEEIIDGRTVTFEITNVKGANVGENKTCIVNISENNPLEGIYIVGGADAFGTGTISCNLSMVPGDKENAYLDFGMGNLITMKLTNLSDTYDKCDFSISPMQVVGVHATYGDVYFMYGMVENQGVSNDSSKSLIGSYKDKTFTFDVPVYAGFGLLCSGGWFNFYCRTSDVPLTMYKKQ